MTGTRIRRDGAEDAYVRRVLVNVSVDDHRPGWRRERSTAELADFVQLDCHSTTTAGGERVLTGRSVVDVPYKGTVLDEVTG